VEARVPLTRATRRRRGLRACVMKSANFQRLIGILKVPLVFSDYEGIPGEKRRPGINRVRKGVEAGEVGTIDCAKREQPDSSPRVPAHSRGNDGG